MKKLLVILVVMASVNTLRGQATSPEQSPICDPDLLFCDIQDELNGFSETMYTEDDVTEGPAPLCNNQGAPHNTSWFGFVAGSTSMTLTFDLFNCTPADCNGDGTLDCWGVQLGCYESCDFQNAVFCDVDDCTPDAAQDPYTGLYQYQSSYFLDDLIVGDDYYVFLDGCAGSFCDYILTVTGTKEAETPPFDTDGIICTNCDDLTDICTGAEITFQPLDEDGNPYDLSILYDWELTDPSGSTTPTQIEGDFEFTTTFNTPGTYSLCVTASTVCDSNDQECIDIIVSDIDDEDFGEVTVCQDILNNGVNPNDLFGSTDPANEVGNVDLNGDGESGFNQNLDIFGPEVVMSTAVNDFGCEWVQTLDIMQEDNVPETAIITYFCKTESVILPGDPQVVIDEFLDDEIIDYTALNGCSSTYLVTAWELEVDGYTIVQGPCGQFGIDIFFDPASIELIDIDLDDYLEQGGFSWIWIRNGIPITGTENLPSYNVPFGDTALYSVLLTMEITDPYTGVLVSCPQIPPSNSPSNSISVDPAASSPMITVTSPEYFCPEDSMSVTLGLDILGFDTAAPGDFTITWTVPTDVTVVSGGSSSEDVIELDYSLTLDNSVSNQVCYEVLGTCGAPTSDCIEVDFAPQASPLLDLTGVACPGGTFEFIGNGVDLTFTAIDTIFWDLNGGDLISGDTTGVGPIEVMWPTTDATQKVVSITVSYVEQCLQYTDDVTIDFIIDPVPPVITCFSNQNTITYEWGTVADATEYLITLPDGSVVSTTETSYEITGLQENECRDIQVEAITDSGTVIYCQQILGSSPEGLCCTKECPETTASLTIPYTQSICLGLNDDPMDFIVTYTPAGDPGNGVPTFSGPGITDSQQGTFDPSVAGVGNHIIEYYFEYTDTDISGCRTPVASAMITVYALPTFTMSVDNTTVCVGEPVTISFDGTYDQSLATNLVTNGATIIDDNDPQNIIVSWDTRGPKTITSEIDVPGCMIIQQTEAVTVDDLPEINIQCMPTSSSITYTWNTDPGFDDYTVTVDDGTGPTVVTVGVGMYEVLGLNPGDGVLFSVVGNSGNSCPDVTALENDCIAENCAEINLTADGFSGIENICMDGTEAPITITGTIDDPSQLNNPDPIVITANTVELIGGLFDPAVLGAGTYQIELLVQDGNCPFFDSFVIEVEDVPTLDVTAPTLICITDTWSLDYTGEVNGDFTYDWSIDDGPATAFSGTADQSVDFDTPGNYTLTVNATTANCQSTPFVAMVEVVDSLITPQIQCQEDIDEILISWLDGNDECDNSYTISINGQVVSNSTDVTYLIEDLMPDTQVTIMVTNESDNCICEDKPSIVTCRTLACPPLAIEITDPARVICRTSTETLGMEVFDVVATTGDLTDYTISYTSDATLMGDNTLDPNGLVDGLYTVTVTAVDGPCDATASATLEISTIPSLSFDYDQEICIEDDLTVTYTGDNLGAFTYEWISTSPIGFADQISPVITYDVPGVYTYTFSTMSDLCPVGSSAIVAVTVLDSLRTPVIDCTAGLDQIELVISIEQSNCPGNVMVLIDGVQTSGNLTQGTILLEGLDAETDFVVEVINTSQCGCSDKSLEIICRTLDCPEFNFEPSCDASLDSVTFEWELDEPDCGGMTTVTVDGELFTGDISNNSITIDGLDAETDVDFVVDYISNCGCDSTFMTQTCRTLDCPDLNFSNVCDPSFDEVTLTWSIDEPDCGGGVTTVTVDGDPYTGDISNNMITIEGLTADSDVDFVISYTSECGCDDVFEVSCVTLPCPPQDLQIVNQTDQWCLTDQMITYDLEATAGGVSLLPSDVIWSGLGINSLGTIELSPGDVTPGTELYIVNYSLAGCIYADTTSIQYIAQPTFGLEVIEPCPGEETALLNIINAEESDNIVYSLDGIPLSGLTNIPLSAGSHQVTSLAYDLCDDLESVSFDVQPVVEIEIIGDTMSFAGVENPYDIISNYTFDLVEWEFNGTVISDGAPTTFAYFEEGELCVTGYIDDCPTTTCVNMLVNSEKVFVSNIFNPMAPDPINTTLQVFSNVEIKEIASMSVFDRWGNRVFHVENADPTDPAAQWDGTSYSGEPLEQGVYLYAGEIEFLSGEIRKFVGDVTLVR